LNDAIGRVAELERALLRVDDVERLVSELRERAADDESAAALWRAVDGLRGRAEQALALLGRLGLRLEELEAAARAARERPAEPPAAPTLHIVTEERHAQLPDPGEGHVLFALTDEGYGIVSCDGPVPSAGAHVELEPGRELVVLRVGRSPLPGDRRPCAFVQPVF
jgi:hypothetical protein